MSVFMTFIFSYFTLLKQILLLMLHSSLINPKSIVIVGGTNNLSSPGGHVLKNLIDHKYKGELFVVNPKKDKVQGVASYRDIQDLPEVDLAIIAIAAKFVLNAVEVLTEKKNTKGFIIYSAGFSELDEEGAKLERTITEQIQKVGGSLLGPNNIGIINSNYAGVFTSPIPKLDPQGVDLISGSGATAVFILELASRIGLRFSSVFSLGNSAQIGVEDILEYFDTTFDPNHNSKVKLLYIESIKNPRKFLKHARSLVNKGCKIAAIKAGCSEAGSRAASSHTGALASSDVFVNALFEKSGIIRCYSKIELIYVAGILLNKESNGKNIAIITHAGGPAVMLTDVLSQNGLNIPQLNDCHQKILLDKLFNGASANNPIDILATGTAEQLEFILDHCDQNVDEIDAMAVIFGSPGLAKVDEAFNVISKKAKTGKKPIYAILPSVINSKKEIKRFIKKNNIAFADEVLFGSALAKAFYRQKPIKHNKSIDLFNAKEIKALIESATEGYLSPDKTKRMLTLAEIPFVEQYEISTDIEAIELSNRLKYPAAMKVVGPLHKSDVGGVLLNVENREQLLKNFDKLMQIKDAASVIAQPMINGVEIFIGAKKEGNFPHIVMCGLGGIYIEAFKDVSSCMIPVSETEATNMIESLKSYSILKGIRGQKGINLERFSILIRKISGLLELIPEISELDINPLLASGEEIVAVDARIRIEK